MELFSRVRAALIKLENGLLLRQIFVLMVVIALACLALYPGNLQALMLVYTYLLFAYMMLEDLFFQTVDMVLWYALFLCMQIYAFSMQFYIDFFIGTVIFSFLFSCSWKIEPAINCQDSEQQKEAGFLPSLFLAMLLWHSFLQPLQWVEKLSEGYEVFFLGLQQEPIWLAALLAPILFILFRLIQLRRAEARQELIQYTMGGGDIWICSAWAAFYGVQVFMGILFMALFIHALTCYLVIATSKGGPLYGCIKRSVLKKHDNKQRYL